MQGSTLTDRLAQNPDFKAAVLAGIKLSGLHESFPGHGTTTMKEARRKVRYLEQQATSGSAVEENTEFVGDRATYSAKATHRITTLQELLDFCRFDGETWEVERWSCNKWEVGAKDASHQVQVTALYQVKATFRRKAVVVAALAEIERLETKARDYAPVYLPFLRPVEPASGNLLEISIPDLHIGKLAWAKECGEPYDVAIAETVFREALDALVARAAPYIVEKFLFVVGNDLLHVDNPHNTTFNGTPQDHDSRYHRTFMRAFDLMVEAIDRLLAVADVDVMIVPGNHDQTAAWHLGHSLTCWYNRCAQVTVDNRPMLRKYYEWGKVMLVFTHGDKEKPISKLANLAADEEPEMWGRTRYREAHIGHLHHNELKDEPGFSIRRLPSLSAADNWHKAAGFVGAPRQAQSFVWNSNEGLVGTQVYNVPRR